jgi:hypothetical protein
MPDLLPSKSLVLCLLATACGAITSSPPATARLRVAHVSPGAPAVDFCLARHGTTQFTGPILAGLDDFTRLPELTPGASATLAAEDTLGGDGQGDAGFTLRGYDDDTEVPPGQARLRLVHRFAWLAPTAVRGISAGVGR